MNLLVSKFNGRFLGSKFGWGWCSEAPCGAMERDGGSCGELVEWSLPTKTDVWIGSTAEVCS